MILDGTFENILFIPSIDTELIFDFMWVMPNNDHTNSNTAVFLVKAEEMESNDDIEIGIERSIKNVIIILENKVMLDMREELSLQHMRNYLTIFSKKELRREIPAGIMESLEMKLKPEFMENVKLGAYIANAGYALK
ncbi:MAG: hypothetical protein N4A44_00845 [Alphaproteobacteria bacterium]|jgi:hypothetical protein|nr:hypothetical protein [Alphaproteobacteria bacterium]